jgi:hypothetical protein
MTELKSGTRVELRGTPPILGWFPGVVPEIAVVVRWTVTNGNKVPGWHIVKFADGGKLCVHESNFRVVDNR